MVELRFPDGETVRRPLASLEAMPATRLQTAEDRLAAGFFGRARDLQRLVTYEKLKGSLHEVIYSMEAAQIDFYPYQFKPILKFIESPTERLIIADEVGLGKTIESALIWIELQARRQAQRLLVVCPKMLADKWRDELRSKFLLDARIVSFDDLAREIAEVKQNGGGGAFAVISTYTGLRPPKAELKLLDEPPDEEKKGAPKTEFLRDLRFWTPSFAPFDLVIFDEAHYMRNPATTTYHLGESLAANAGAVLCVSATPVHNSNTDLRSLLRLVDEDFFESEGLFDELLMANRPTVAAANALSRTPIDMEILRSAISEMKESPFISNSPLFQRLLDQVKAFDPSDKATLAVWQDWLEKLNMLGQYINRTRRVQVAENRPDRDPMVLSVEYCQEEMAFYRAILKLVRHYCKQDDRPFHVFQVMGLQLRAASCLPALAQEIREGRLGDPGNLLDEAFGEEVLADELAEDGESGIRINDIPQILSFDFESNDTKYGKLRDMLVQMIPNEKVVVFAFYRRTLAYLGRRLASDGINVTTIHGGMANEQRWEELERFKDPRGPRILLSSEVGSEGIDLQFCRIMVNYDLPWNPMRVEQRIGRIDRVGQQAKRIVIVNFKVLGTIEERLYERLHSKLARFANSLGDLEAVIGQEVQQLTIDLLSRELTPEQEARRMEQAERVIETRLLQIQALEESGDALIALSDYVQRKIEEDRGKGRYIQPDELEDYVTDFFERSFRGCQIDHNTPTEGCLRIRLTQEAQNALSEYMADDRSLSARQLRHREFALTFRREVWQRLASPQRQSVRFVNHLSPLIRWITSENRKQTHGFFDVSALLMQHSILEPGDYCYRIERWKLKGLLSRERLAYGVRPLAPGSRAFSEDPESVVQHLLRNGRDWTRVDCDQEALRLTHKTLEEELAERFSAAVMDFEDENKTAHQIKARRVMNFFDRRVEQDQRRLGTLREAGRNQRMIRLTEARLATALQNRAHRLRELETRAAPDIESGMVAAGVFRVTPSQSDSE